MTQNRKWSSLLKSGCRTRVLQRLCKTRQLDNFLNSSIHRFFTLEPKCWNVKNRWPLQVLSKDCSLFEIWKSNAVNQWRCLEIWIQQTQYQKWRAKAIPSVCCQWYVVISRNIWCFGHAMLHHHQLRVQRKFHRLFQQSCRYSHADIVKLLHHFLMSSLSTLCLLWTKSKMICNPQQIYSILDRLLMCLSCLRLLKRLLLISSLFI